MNNIPHYYSLIFFQFFISSNPPANTSKPGSVYEIWETFCGISNKITPIDARTGYRQKKGRQPSHGVRMR